MKQVIDTAAQVTGLPVPVQYGPRRAGDPAQLVADATRARSVLGWQPKFAALETIVRNVWAWELKH